MMDPTRQYCQCGWSFKPTIWHKVLMLVRGCYVRKCPRCQTRMTLVLYNFVVCKRRETVDKKELWKHG